MVREQKSTAGIVTAGALVVLFTAFVGSVSGQRQPSSEQRGAAAISAPAEKADLTKDSSIPQNASVGPTSIPPCVQNRDPGPGGAGRGPQSFADYVTGIKAIIQGEVQSVDDGPVTGPGARGANRQLVVSTLKVTNVLKSSVPLQQVAAGAFNFGGTFAMKPGQRYILFLDDENASGIEMVPEHSGVPRFRISAALCVEETDRIYSSTRGSVGLAASVLNPVMGPLDGLPLNKVLAEIQAAVGRRIEK